MKIKAEYGSRVWIENHPIQTQYPYGSEVRHLAREIWESQQSQKLYRMHLDLFVDEKFQATVMERATPESISREQKYLDMAIEREQKAHQSALEQGLTDAVAAYIAEGME